MGNIELLTIPQACEYLHMTRSALATLRYTGKGPRFLAPTSRTILYRRGDLDAWLDASERTITGQVAA